MCCRSLSGGELFDQIADEDYKMTEAEVIRYMRQVCDGLQHMHEQNIVHLDIKVGQHSVLSLYHFVTESFDYDIVLLCVCYKVYLIVSNYCMFHTL